MAVKTVKTPAQKALAKALREVKENALFEALRRRLPLVGQRYVVPPFAYEQFGMKPRKFEWDIVVQGKLPVLIEVQGGVWTGGAHGRGWGIERDVEKQNIAAILGYRTMAFTDLRGKKLLEAVELVVKAVGA